MSLGLPWVGGRSAGSPPRTTQRRRGRARTPRERGVLLVFIVVAGTQTTWGIVIPVLPLYVGTLTASASVLGAAVAVFGLGRLLINIPAGIATRRLDHRAMLVVGTLVVAASTLATGYVDSVEQLLWTRFVTGLGGGVVVTTGQTMLTQTDPRRLGRTMSGLQAFQLAGGALGPALGGFLVGLGVGVPFLACGVGLAVLAVAAAVCPLPDGRGRAADVVPESDPADGSSVWTRGLVAVSIVGFTVFFVRFGGQQFMFPVLAYDWAGITPAVLGVLITGSTVLNLLLVGPSGVLTDRWGRRRTVVAATVAVGFCTLGFLGSASAVVFGVALVATGVAMAFTGPSTGAFLAESVPPAKRGTAVGIYRTAGDVAILLGPLCLGWLLEAGHVVPAILLLALVTLASALLFAHLTRTTQTTQGDTMTETFDPFEASVADIEAAYAAGTTTCVALAEYYLDRIERFDRSGPGLNSIITVSPTVLEDAAALDAAYAAGGPVGPLHGVPVLVKDQVDTVGMPTTLGSVLLKDFHPDQDGVVVQKLRAAGALILAKTTLGELAGGDAHGSLFGSTRNPYDLERTPGGSSGGSGAAVSANLGAVSVAQEGLASIRRPAAWNSCVGMRPSLGLVSRTGAYGCWPSRSGSLGPITRTVADAAVVLDAIEGFDPEDPSTSWGVDQLDGSFVSHLDDAAVDGARIGVLRDVMGLGSDPAADDFRQSRSVFDTAVAELASAGATVVDPVEVEDLLPLLARRAFDSGKEAFERWMDRNEEPPYPDHESFVREAQYERAMWLRGGGRPSPWQATWEEYLVARDTLRTNLLLTLARHELDAIVHVTVEHTPTLIADGTAEPYVNMLGAPHLNTFLYDVPSITVPAGFTGAGLPVGITFLGRPYSDQRMVALAHSYEVATRHRVPPASTPA